jgi:hypothetical protein
MLPALPEHRPDHHPTFCDHPLPDLEHAMDRQLMTYPRPFAVAGALGVSGRESGWMNDRLPSDRGIRHGLPAISRGTRRTTSWGRRGSFTEFSVTTFTLKPTTGSAPDHPPG